MKSFTFVNVKLICFIILLLVLPACSVEVQPQPETSQAEVYKTLDEQFLEVGAEVPGFAGIYYDDDNSLVVNVAQGELQTTSAASIESTLVDVFGQDALGSIETLSGQSVQPTLKTQKVKYSFEELYKLLGKIERKAEQKGINVIDIDEKANKVYLGVENEKVAKKLRKQVAKLKLPEDAVQVAVEKAPTPTATTLRDEVRPTQGGLDIGCTLGFNAIFDGIRGFVTNSHCTKTLGRSDGTKFYQNRQSRGGSRIGIETIDPPFGGSGGISCSVSKNCRYSDAAFIAYDSSVNVGLGKIVRVSNKPGIEITPKNPLPVTGKRTSNSQLYSGRIVEKVGRTTGVTAGKIIRTCIKSRQRGTDKRFICQYRADANSDPGDSGSPVYTIESKGVRISGIVWGSSDNRFIFSPISGIERDFGKPFAVR